MAFNRGYKGVLEVEDPANPGSWIEIDGQTGASLNENAETADTTHKPPRGTIAAAYKTQTATTKNFELSVEGKTNYDDPGFKELFTKGRATTPVNLRFTTAESLATPGTFYGYTFSAIPNIQHDFPLEDSVGYSLGFILQSEPVYSENLA